MFICLFICLNKHLLVCHWLKYSNNNIKYELKIIKSSWKHKIEYILLVFLVASIQCSTNFLVISFRDLFICIFCKCRIVRHIIGHLQFTKTLNEFVSTIIQEYPTELNWSGSTALKLKRKVRHKLNFIAQTQYKFKWSVVKWIDEAKQSEMKCCKLEKPVAERSDVKWGEVKCNAAWCVLVSLNVG